MKKLLIISVLAILFCGSNGSAQNVRNTQKQKKPRIVSVVKEIFNIPKDFNIIPYCFDKNEIIDYTLIVRFYTQNMTYPNNDRKDSINFYNGVLNFSDAYIYDNVVDSTVTIDKGKGKRTVSFIYKQPSIQIDGMHPHQKRTYKLVGFKEAPSVIQFEGKTLCHCPTKPIKFEIYKNDTINVLNENGHKDGLWLLFYENGKVKERQYFKNGENRGGYGFDETGKAIYRIEATYPEVRMPINF